MMHRPHQRDYEIRLEIKVVEEVNINVAVLLVVTSFIRIGS